MIAMLPTEVAVFAGALVCPTGREELAGGSSFRSRQHVEMGVSGRETG